jgi:pimeloyl-ACP methyl ester carboxylesterase
MIRRYFTRSLILILFAPTLMAALSSRPVRLMTDDNVTITGMFYPAATNSEITPAVLLVHSLGSSRNEWPGVPQMLQRNGIACLAIDLRGHGASNRKLTVKGPELVDYQLFTERDHATMLLDLNAAINWLTEQTEIDKHRIAIIGSGIGASLALQYASFNTDLHALLLISPLDYRGLSPVKSIEKIGPIALRIYVSQYDDASYETAKQLIAVHKEMGYSSDNKTLVVCSGNLRGGDMLRGVDQLPQVMLAWLEQVLLGKVPPAPEPAQPDPKTKSKKK